MTSVTIPNSVTSIGNKAFYSEPGNYDIGGKDVFISFDLREVISKIEEPFPIENKVFGDDFLLYGTLYVPKGTVEKYKATEGWREVRHIVEQ